MRCLPSNPRASAFWAHSIDLADRSAGSFSEAGRGMEAGLTGAAGLPPSIVTAAVCAATPKVKRASEAIRATAQAQTRVATRIFKNLPVARPWSNYSLAAYKGQVRNFKPSEPRRTKATAQSCVRIATIPTSANEAFNGIFPVSCVALSSPKRRSRSRADRARRPPKSGSWAVQSQFSALLTLRRKKRFPGRAKNAYLVLTRASLWDRQQHG